MRTLLFAAVVAVVAFSGLMDLGLWFGWFYQSFGGLHYVPSWTVTALSVANIMLIGVSIYLVEKEKNKTNE